MERRFPKLLWLIPETTAIRIMTFLTEDTLNEVHNKEDMIASVQSSNVLTEVASRTCMQI